MRKKLLALTMITVMAITSLSGCKSDNKDSSNSNSNNSSESGSKELETIKIGLDWSPNTNHTGMYVAMEKGYFEELGIKVEFVDCMETGAEGVVGAGTCQFGVSFQDTLAPLFASEDALPITAVGTIIQHNTSGIISLKDKDIKTPKDMTNHSYATWDLPVELATIKEVVNSNGGDFSKVNLIPSTVSDVVSAFKTDSVDSVWIYYAWDGIATQVAGLETNFFNFADYAQELDFYNPVIIANNAFLEKEPETAKNFMKALKKGYEYAIENPEDAANILCKCNPELDKDIVLASQKWLAGKYKDDVERWGYIDPARWDKFYGWLNENKLVENELSAGTGFTNDYLPE